MEASELRSLLERGGTERDQILSTERVAGLGAAPARRHADASARVVAEEQRQADEKRKRDLVEADAARRACRDPRRLDGPTSDGGFLTADGSGVALAAAGGADATTARAAKRARKEEKKARKAEKKRRKAAKKEKKAAKKARRARSSSERARATVFPVVCPRIKREPENSAARTLLQGDGRERRPPPAGPWTPARGTGGGYTLALRRARA